MNCPRCHAEVADTATICPSCGMQLRSSTPTTATFSYLPAGTPAWPAGIPSQIAYEVNPNVAAVKGGKLAQEKPARSASSILTIVAVLVIVPLLGAVLTFNNLHNSGRSATQAAASSGSTGSSSQTQPSTAGATPTTATGGQLPAPASFQKLTSIASAIGVTMSYPSDWVVESPQLSSSNNYVRLYPPQQQQVNILLVIYRYSTQASATITSAADMNQQILQVISTETGFNNLQVSQTPPAPRTIGGASWSEADATYTDDSGNAMHIVSLAVQHNKMYYNIVVLIPDVYYSDAMQKYIQPMLNSIQFSA